MSGMFDDLTDLQIYGHASEAVGLLAAHAGNIGDVVQHVEQCVAGSRGNVLLFFPAVAPHREPSRPPPPRRTAVCGRTK